MATLTFHNGTIILEDRLLTGALLDVDDGRIAAIKLSGPAGNGASVDLDGGYLAPGFVDIHVHGGKGSDFMDGTEAAFRTACRAHACHGTTSLLPTTTVGSHQQLLAFLGLCRKLKTDPADGARILGAHFYGPYFAYEARGAHPGAGVRPPAPAEYEQYLAFADSIITATVAPELPGAEGFVRACRARGIRCNTGHSHATFTQMEAAVGWGVTHIDHLFCAMSDRARLRLSQTYPMRGGVLEATLFFDELTTEVIADGKHLQRELLMLAYKIKGPERLALVTDCNRALDMPDGPYMMGPLDGGEPILKGDGVGLMPDGKSLGSSVVGMDHCVRTFHQFTGVPLETVIRMASLTPARIAGQDQEIGSLAVGKRADLVVLDRELNVRLVFRDGRIIWGASLNPRNS
jgi:N-acetylglucosamine-6-phosphate deacetylase